MPRIKEYSNQQVFSGDPVTGAAGAQANLARAQDTSGYYSGIALQKGFNAVAEGIDQVEQHIARTETSKLAADFATAHAELADEWRQTAQKADPNDHGTASRFMEKSVKPRLAAIGDGLLTEQAKQLYAKSSAGLTAELFTKSSADQANLAGEAAVTNLDTVKNQLSNVVRSDPTAMNNVLGLANMSIDGLVSQYGLPREEAEKLGRSVRGEIAKSAAYGAADLNPTAAKAALERGDFDKYLDGTEVQGLINYADQRLRAEESAKKAADVEVRRQETETAHKVATGISASVIDPETGVERLPPDYFQNIVKYSQMPGATESTVSALRSAGERMLKAPIVKSDPDIKADFLSRIWLATDDPNKLTLTDLNAAFGGGSLSKADHTAMRQAIMDANKDPAKAENMRQFAKGVAKFKSFISRSSLYVSDSDGDKAYGDFQQEKINQFQDGLKAGKSARDMLDETNKDYIFKDVARFKPSNNAARFQQSIKGETTTPLPVPTHLVPWAGVPPYSGAAVPNARPSTLTPRRPGESVEDFLKRAQ